jgi:Pyridine nucleotide-disulphide oxidoreductase, dimerisation domain
VWGKRSEWVNYSGELDGEQVGAVIMPGQLGYCQGVRISAGVKRRSRRLRQRSCRSYLALNNVYPGRDVVGKHPGAHVLGPHADDVINLFTTAMRTGATASSLRGILFAYPTPESDILQRF